MRNLNLKELLQKYNIRDCSVCLSKEEFTISREETWLMQYKVRNCYVKLTRLSDQDLLKSTVRVLTPSTESVRSHVLWLPIIPNSTAAFNNFT